MQKLKISVLMTREATDDGIEWWIAQCLEYDIATQARSLEDAFYDLERMLVARMVTGQELGVDPFAGLAPAPAECWEKFMQLNSGLKMLHEPSYGSRETKPPMVIKAPAIEARVANC